MKYRYNLHILFQEIDDESVLVFPENAMIYALNETASLIVKELMSRDCSYDHLLECLQEQFDVERSVLNEDLTQCIDEFKKVKIVHEV